MTSECIFCRIAAGDLDTELVAEGPEWVAFRDLHPQAPAHILVIPRDHIESLDELAGDRVGAALLGGCRAAAARAGLEDGYRVVTNVGVDGGQDVRHLHFHVLGGRRMGWPPG